MPFKMLLISLLSVPTFAMAETTTGSIDDHEFMADDYHLEASNLMETCKASIGPQDENGTTALLFLANEIIRMNQNPSKQLWNLYQDYLLISEQVAKEKEVITQSANDKFNALSIYSSRLFKATREVSATERSVMPSDNMRNHFKTAYRSASVLKKLKQSADSRSYAIGRFVYNQVTKLEKKRSELLCNKYGDLLTRVAEANISGDNDYYHRQNQQVTKMDQACTQVMKQQSRGFCH